jgi:hypothetical protein
MTPERYRQCLDAMRLSQAGLAPLLHCSTALTKAWAIGQKTIPTAVAVWLEACVANRNRHPEPKPPKHWRAEHKQPYSMAEHAVWARARRAKQRATS